MQFYEDTRGSEVVDRLAKALEEQTTLLDKAGPVYIKHLERRIEVLTGRVDELLEANNNEVERRREAEALANLTKRTNDMLLRQNIELFAKYEHLKFRMDGLEK
jgi:hypothetical protein